MLTKWVIPNNNKDSVEALHQNTGYARFVCEVLVSRGLDTAEKVEMLIQSAATSKLQDPMSFHGMEEAVERIMAAVCFGERICIYGDYDCDGVTSTTLLVSCLREMGADVCFYIPNRFSEGYGMNNKAIDKIHAAETNLILTVDNGISAVAEVEYALSLGMDVVVTDHHAIPDGPLPAVTTINPHLPECGSSFEDICGVGVAFYLACALTKSTPEELLEKYGDIVAFGTVADVMPLVEDNRLFVIKGLQMLKERRMRPGLKALMEIAKVEDRSLSSRTFGFQLGPRVNAAGRMGDAKIAVDMLLNDDYERALEIAHQLDDLNAQRKKIEEDVMKEIDEIIAANPHLIQRRAVVVCGDGWHQGVIGIVAAHLVERYGKPAIVFTAAEGVAHGSGRSIPEISLIEAISACKGHLVRFGGHQQAAGLTLNVDNLETFADALDAFLIGEYPIAPLPSINIDAEIAVEDLSVANVKALSVMEPFGEQNPSPQFAIIGATVVDFDSLSQGKHTKVFFRKGETSFNTLYFNVAPGDFPYQENDVVDILVQLEVGEYRGNEQLSMFLRGIKPTGFDAGEVVEDYEAYSRHIRGMYGEGCDKELLRPSREDIAAAFRLVRGRAMIPTPAEFVYTHIEELSYQKTLVVFDVMVEMGFVQNHGSNYLLADVTTRRNLDDSEILKRLS